ncbi:diacylglycerol kinase theta [Caerostris darwini]|uniref:diacylglycerol kinase (ATP) n=1 Tax=Caerostris darwini TaxID=1538125 RepID=A0AAV4SBQ1_9ARAC|nr:diacylglycerol kinase theta [Caerostris darwini]
MFFFPPQNPVPHCWGEPGHLKRRFCNVCRKRIEDSCAVRCEVCDYSVHVECQDFGVADCKEVRNLRPKSGSFDAYADSSLEGRQLTTELQVPILQKDMLAHPSCYRSLPLECTFGCLESIMLPPACVSIPRTDVPLETIIGGQVKKRDTISRESPLSYHHSRSISEEFSSSGDLKGKEYDESSQKDKEEETIKVFDGNGSMKTKMSRTITMPRNASKEQVIAAALRAFHVYDDLRLYYITDAYDPNEKELDSLTPLQNLTRKDGRAAIFIRFRSPDPESGYIKVYPGKLGNIEGHQVIQVTSDDEVNDVMERALEKFGLDPSDVMKYRLSEVSLDKGTVHERAMDNQESPWELIKNIARESIRQKELTRFCLRQKEDLQSSSVALFVGNLPPNLSQRQYEMLLLEMLGKRCWRRSGMNSEDKSRGHDSTNNQSFSAIPPQRYSEFVSAYRFRDLGPIYYEYGSLIISYDNADIAVKCFYMLREVMYEDKYLLVLLLPNLLPDMVPRGIRPLLVFVNVKSGGCQGMELISSFRRFLNPYQVYDLENGGPLPGLYVFRHIRDYKILVCGGDGTVGWVLQCLDNVGQDSECQSPPCAILPLGTGNDLARVLRWGPGYTGGEEPLNILKDVIEAEEITLDRWTVVFHVDEKEDNPGGGNPGSAQDSTAIFVMNNYFGIGIDASLCLDFHNAREENPNKFNSR